MAERHCGIRLRGQAVKTSPFHGGNTGSIPVGVTLVRRIICFAGRLRTLGHENPASQDGPSRCRQTSSQFTT